MQHKSLCVLGRQPAIGRAELESMLGAEHLEPVGDFAIASDIAPQNMPFDRLGSSIRLAKPVAQIDKKTWPETSRTLVKQLPALLNYLPTEGKVKLGVSVFGLEVSTDELFRTGLELKKACKKAGRSARVVPNSDLTLNSAQVLHNQLTGDLGIELLLIKTDAGVYVAQTLAIQDIDAYAKRDQGRPKRDARVGMLPPKLAQTIVNLGVGWLGPAIHHVVLDPFCGTGVVLQEAILMGYGAYGTDLEPRMVDYTRANLEWLTTHGQTADPLLEVGDATTHQWQQSFSAVACEAYLGRPLSSWPDPAILREIIGTCNVITERFLKNIAGQIPSGTRLCLAVPAWQAPDGRLHHLPMLDQLEHLGYNRVSFSWAQTKEMAYRRPEQFVARELLVITRK